MNDRLAVTAALASLAKPGMYQVSRKDWAALVKKRWFDAALDAECRSWPTVPGVYTRSFYRLFAGKSFISHQQVVVAKNGNGFFIVLTPEEGSDRLRLLPIESVGGYFELIREHSDEEDGTE